MLKLDYIFVGNIPEQQRMYLQKNLQACGFSEETDPQLLWEEDAKQQQPERTHPGNIWTENRLREYRTEQGILISGNPEELRAAKRLGMAALGYIPVSDDAESFAAETSPADMYAEGFDEVDLKFLRHVYERHHHLPWTIVSTERCVIREFSMQYLDDLFELYSGEGMTEYMEALYPYEQERQYQQAYIEQMYGFYGYGMWIVCEKGTGVLIGRAGIEHREELGGALELGYAIGVPYQRKGYATEVCAAILEYAQRELGSRSIHCLIQAGNVASERFAEKLGFRTEGVVDVDGRPMKKYTKIL